MNINNHHEILSSSFKDKLFGLSANETALYASLIGIALAQELTITEQNSLGNILMLIAQELCTMAVQNQAVETRRQKRTNNGQGYIISDHH